MALHYIWVFFFGVAFIVAIIKTLSYYFRESLFQLTNWDWVLNPDNQLIFETIMNSTFDMAKTSVTISIALIGVMVLWLGIMRIGEEGGAINLLSKVVGPFFNKLFPEVPKNHPATGSMLMNFSANMLGLDNAATPLGLKAMNQLQELNPKKEEASNAQIMFLVLNTSGLTIVPVSVMAIRNAQGANNPSDVFLPILIATYFASLVGLFAVSIKQNINIFNKTILTYLGIATAFIIGLICFISSLPQEHISAVSSTIGNGILLSIIVGFILLAVRKKVNVYNSFIEGAKDGFSIAVKIIPYLVAMLVVIGVFRASGAMDLITDGIAYLIGLAGLNTDFVGALPTAIMKPLSGSGARGMMVEAIETYGVDSFVGRLASTFQGSTETTFYTLAVYFGAVGVKNTRYSVTCGLIADAAGIIAAIAVCYLFFG